MSAGFCCSVMQQIISSVMCNNLLVPIQKILSERNKHLARCSSGSKMTRFRSIYRDVLFLTFVALGQQNIYIGKLFPSALAHLTSDLSHFTSFSINTFFVVFFVICWIFISYISNKTEDTMAQVPNWKLLSIIVSYHRLNALFVAQIWWCQNIESKWQSDYVWRDTFLRDIILDISLNATLINVSGE